MFDSTPFRVYVIRIHIIVKSRSSFRDIPSTSLDGWHKRGYIYNPISDTQNITLCSRDDEYSVVNEPIRGKKVCSPYHRHSFFFFLTLCIQNIIHKNYYNIHLHHNLTAKALFSTTMSLFPILTHTHCVCIIRLVSRLNLKFLFFFFVEDQKNDGWRIIISKG